MTKYLIVEDERLAYQELKRMMGNLRPEYLFAGRTKAITETIRFLEINDIDLILLDVSLSDGYCFEIFDHLHATVPIIFTTAYDEYAIQAFTLNSVDYLLKPIEEEKLAIALAKYERLHCLQDLQKPSFDYTLVEKMLPRQTKNRFLIQKGDSYLFTESNEIAFFYSENKVVFLHTFENKRYIIDYTLDQLEKQLDKSLFFRVSRNCITHVKAIKHISKFFNSRLKITFHPQCPHEVLISRARVNDFLQWIDGII